MQTGANKLGVGSLLVVFLLLAGWAEAQERKPTVRRHRVPVEPTLVERAEAALEKQQYDEAEQLLQQAVEAEPADYRAWFHLGFLYTATERRPQAVEAYRRSVEAKNDVFESNLNLGLLLAAGGEAAEAERYLRAATALKPSAQGDEGQARAWLSLGRLLQQTKPEEALAALRRAAELRPQDPEPRLTAGALLEARGDLAGAETQYKAAAELIPDSPEPLAALANVYAAGQKFAEAEAVLRRYLELKPEDQHARLQLARVLAAAGRQAEALELMEAAVRGQAADPEMRRELAGLYVSLQRLPEAEEHYRSLVEARGDDAELRHALGVVLLKQRKFAEAQQQLIATLQLKPGLADAYADLALAASETKNYALTIQALDARARYLPETPGTYFLRATAYDHLKSFAEAAHNYREFLVAAQGRYPDQEWQARHRLNAIDPKRKR